jgi:benzoyl-CoA reductase/2-hydroxyglutaryl-CoA dehydratase subunit BcrC/BadD/HgdB
VSARIGITSTVPIEAIYAAGLAATDLNNVFIESAESGSLVDQAERRGFPESSCAWIKGIYSAVKREGMDRVVAVTQGDCSNTHALMEVLEVEGIETIPFMYPYDRDARALGRQIGKLCERLGTEVREAERVRLDLEGVRARAREIDRLTWEEGRVGGVDNHYYQVSCSDMKGDPEEFSKEMDDFIASARNGRLTAGDLRLGYVGIPPIVSGVYALVEGLGGRVVFNELQRQFAMPFQSRDLVDQYLRYTYPYHIRHRIEDIRTEVARRSIDGIIHYVQAFCFRQIEDLILRKEAGIPVLTLEGNRPGKLDLRAGVRIEAFMDMLRLRRSRS